MGTYPIVLDLAGKKVVVAGDGEIAEAKIADLKECEAEVTQISAEQYCADALEGAWLVVAATGDSDLNKKIYQDATHKHIWINAVDDPPNCSAILPAKIRHGKLLLTVSTGGLSPALSAWLRRKLETQIGAEYGELLKVVAEVRREIQKSDQSLELLDWQTALDLLASDEMLDLIKVGDLEEAKLILKKCLLS